MPMWQWVVIYVVIAAVVYGLVYYFVFAKHSNSGYVLPSQQPAQSVATPLPATSVMATQMTVSPQASSMPVVSSQPTTISSTKTVTISMFAFEPSQLTVPVGTIVTFVNNDSVTHTVTSDTGVFNSGNLPTGQSFKYTFTKAGTFLYHCAIHPSMKGTVVVQ